MWEYNHTDELCHYGVKGMKWGVRRDSKTYQRVARRTKRVGKWIENDKRRAIKLVKGVAKIPIGIGKAVVKRVNKNFNKITNTLAAIGETTVSAIKGTKAAFTGKKAADKVLKSPSLVSTQKRKRLPGEIHETSNKTKVDKVMDKYKVY